MKNSILRIGVLLVFLLLNTFYFNAQTAGDLAFVGFNADGDDDLALVALADISANTTIYLTDNETDGSGGLTTGEGTLIWNTGPHEISAGTVIVFTDIDSSSNSSFGVSIGSLSSSGNFGLPASTKDGIIVFLGSDATTPTTFITAIQLGNDASNLGPFDGDGITLTNTGLVTGVNMIVFDDSASPDGAIYNSSRSNQSSYNSYFSQIADDENNWTNVVNGDGETLLPLSTEAFTTNISNWTGTSNSVWNLSTNWDNGIPSSSTLAIIPDVSNAPIISSGTEAKAGNITINSGETLTINNANALTVSGNLTVSGDLTLESNSSLIVRGTISGQSTYKRTLNTSNWYLISSPVSNQDIDDFVTASGLEQNLPNIAFGTYQTSSDTWAYYQNGTSNADVFNLGQGYTINLTASSGTVSFIGNISNKTTSFTLSTTSNGYNLLGNPFTSSLYSDNLSNNTNNLLKANGNDGNDILTEDTIWIWNQDTNSYDPFNHNSNFFLAPTQGFFVKAKTAEDFLIDHNLQNHHNTETFQRTNTSPKITLNLTDNNNSKNTQIYYLANASENFDNGYDSTLFEAADNSFMIYTETLNDNQKLGIQSLPNQNFESMIIPIGIIASSGKEISISANSNNLPTGYNVYLEDKTLGSFTLLNNSSLYTTTLTNNLNGTGRYYLHTTQNSLSNSDYHSNNIQLFVTNKTLRLNGFNEDYFSLKLYNILGKEILSKQINTLPQKGIDLHNLTTGIYIVVLKTEDKTIHKKILIK